MFPAFTGPIGVLPLCLPCEKLINYYILAFCFDLHFSFLNIFTFYCNNSIYICCTFPVEQNKNVFSSAQHTSDALSCKNVASTDYYYHTVECAAYQQKTTNFVKKKPIQEIIIAFLLFVLILATETEKQNKFL